jgi:DNA polymerase III sliding clamp (beta) subunit (PCNA family)
MKPITLPVAELKPALAGFAKVIPNRPTLPILGHVKIERTSDGWIALTGTDLDRFITMRLEHPASGPPASILIPYDQLSQVVKSCGKGESIEVEATPDVSIIRFPLGDTMGESKVPFVATDEFPQMPKLKAEAIPLPTALRESILEAMECASVDSSRYVLNGTFIDASNPKANYIVGTDGRILYSANSFALPLKDSIIIPSHKFLGWKEFNADGEWQLKSDDKYVQLSTRRWRFISKQIDGKYPDWRAPIPNPNDAKTIITLDPSKLETLIKLIQRMPCHDDRFHTLGLEWKAGQLMLMGKDKADEPWLRVPVPDIKGQGPDTTIFVDRHYVEKAFGYGLNTLSLIDPVSPLRFNSGGKTLIVMPVRCEEPPTAAPTSIQPPPVQAANPATPLPEKQPTPSMQTHPHTNGNHPPAVPGGATTAEAANTTKPETKPALEAALLQIESIKTGFRESINGLTKLGDTIRHAMREQKVSEKEIQGVRQTLRSLQGVRI